VFDLGAAAIAAVSARGNVAIAAEQDGALVFVRGIATECSGRGSQSCTTFSFQRLRTGQVELMGRDLSVPLPCVSNAAQLVTTAGRFHYGVCSLERRQPVTTVFSIQYQPEYARADALLRGCKPFGMLQVDDEPWLVGNCDGKRRAVRIPFGDEKPETEDIDALRISCTHNSLRLEQAGFRLTLGAPQARLELLLPASMLPCGARAAWTGASLIVVTGNVSRLETSTYVCRERRLQPLR
jgi:hypothetical protein